VLNLSFWVGREGLQACGLLQRCDISEVSQAGQLQLQAQSSQQQSAG
jgi:hypothetical protein